MNDFEVTEQITDNIRICREWETEDYFWVYGDPDGYENGKGEWITPENERKELYDLIGREGLYIYFCQVKCPCCGQWETVDSVGMVIGDLDAGCKEDFIAAAKERLG